jgi:hypothetical protein
MDSTNLENELYDSSIQKAEFILKQCNSLISDLNYLKYNDYNLGFKNLISKYEEKILILNEHIIFQKKNYKKLNKHLINNVIYFKNKIKDLIFNKEKENEKLKLLNNELKNKIESMSNNYKCKICLDRKINTIINPCMHICSCLECLDHLNIVNNSNNLKCPICQDKIIFYKKCYLV